MPLDPSSGLALLKMASAGLSVPSFCGTFDGLESEFLLWLLLRSESIAVQDSGWMERAARLRELELVVIIGCLKRSQRFDCSSDRTPATAQRVLIGREVVGQAWPGSSGGRAQP